jgi:hypothetical protein
MNSQSKPGNLMKKSCGRSSQIKNLILAKSRQIDENNIILAEIGQK